MSLRRERSMLRHGLPTERPRSLRPNARAREWISPTEAAQVFGVSRATAYRWLRRFPLQRHRLSVAEWLQAGKHSHGI